MSHIVLTFQFHVIILFFSFYLYSIVSYDGHLVDMWRRCAVTGRGGVERLENRQRGRGSKFQNFLRRHLYYAPLFHRPINLHLLELKDDRSVRLAPIVDSWVDWDAPFSRDRGRTVMRSGATGKFHMYNYRDNCGLYRSTDHLTGFQLWGTGVFNEATMLTKREPGHLQLVLSDIPLVFPLNIDYFLSYVSFCYLVRFRDISEWAAVNLNAMATVSLCLIDRDCTPLLLRHSVQLLDTGDITICPLTWCSGSLGCDKSPA